MLFRSVYIICFHRQEAVTAKLKFHESAIYILRPQKLSFEIPVVLKTDLKRRKNALSRGISLTTWAHVPVNDFSRWILSILTCEKSLKPNVKKLKISQKFHINPNKVNNRSKSLSLSTLSYHFLLFLGKIVWFWNGGVRDVRYESPRNTARERRNQDDLRTSKIIIGWK